MVNESLQLSSRLLEHFDNVYHQHLQISHGLNKVSILPRGRGYAILSALARRLSLDVDGPGLSLATVTDVVPHLSLVSVYF